MRGPSLEKLIHTVISFKDIANEDSRNQLDLGRPEDVLPEDFLTFFKADSLNCYGDDISGKEQCINLDHTLWFMLVIHTCKKVAVCWMNTQYMPIMTYQTPIKWVYSSMLNV